MMSNKQLTIVALMVVASVYLASAAAQSAPGTSTQASLVKQANGLLTITASTSGALLQQVNMLVKVLNDGAANSPNDVSGPLKDVTTAASGLTTGVNNFLSAVMALNSSM